jgi:hypothetical protein
MPSRHAGARCTLPPALSTRCTMRRRPFARFSMQWHIPGGLSGCRRCWQHRRRHRSLPGWRLSRLRCAISTRRSGSTKPWRRLPLIWRFIAAVRSRPPRPRPGLRCFPRVQRHRHWWRSTSAPTNTPTARRRWSSRSWGSPRGPDRDCRARAFGIRPGSELSGFRLISGPSAWPFELFPRGLDMLFVAGEQHAALPRSTRITA